jgi:hypothetical protein
MKDFMKLSLKHLCYNICVPAHCCQLLATAVSIAVDTGSFPTIPSQMMLLHLDSKVDTNVSEKLTVSITSALKI